MAKGKVNKKKNERKVIESGKTPDNIKNVVKTIIVIIVILVAFYLLTILILNKKEGPTYNNVTIEYNKIIAGETFEMSDNDYLVFYYDSTGANAAEYADMISKYREKENSLPIYTVDLNNGINKKYISEEEVNSVTNIDDLKVKDATLIRIKDKSAQSYITSSFNEYLDSTVE